MPLTIGNLMCTVTVEVDRARAEDAPTGGMPTVPAPEALTPLPQAQPDPATGLVDATTLPTGDAQAEDQPTWFDYGNPRVVDVLTERVYRLLQEDLANGRKRF